MLRHNAALYRRTVLVLAAAVAAVVPLPPAWVERWYSNTFYVHTQALFTPLSNLVPFALFDLLVAGTLGAWLFLAVTDIRHLPRTRAISRLALRTLTWSATLYLAFLLLWGLNYRRTPLMDKLQFDAQAVSPRNVLALASISVQQLNSNYDQAHGQGWSVSPDPWLGDSFGRVQRELGSVRPATPGRPKVTLLSPLFRRTGVEGMTDPYFLETLIESGLLPFERPMVIAHEWGHLAGYADESEASFAGWLTCLHGSVGDQYSGWLFIFEELESALGPKDRGDLVRALARGPRADLRAIAERQRKQISPAASRASGRIYDLYLKGNRVEEGIRSYDEVVKLALGVQFDPEWKPRRVR